MILPRIVVEKKVSKSILSMFLRTRCDKELFLSLHDNKTMGPAGLPGPVRRPGIGTLSLEGRAFEVERNDQLVRLFPGIIHFFKASNQYKDVDLKSKLLAVQSTPAIILQGKFSVASIKDQILLNIGLDAADIGTVPILADFVPDVIVVRPPDASDLEILTNGARTPISVRVERRSAISIFDIKHTSESNPSYCAEIALYSLMLSNWIQSDPVLRDLFYISTKAFLWTRFKQGVSELDRLETSGSATILQLLEALVKDSEDANLRFYLASVRKFFEDVIRVIRIGDATPDGWKYLDWHVCGTCSACDWLGDKRHLSRDKGALVDATPDHYCLPTARSTGHLSCVPGITRGAKKILQQNSLPNTAVLAGTPSSHPALQKHTFLKRDARTLPSRTVAINSGTISNDPSAAIASLVAAANLLLYASVNFDSSSGLITGMAISGIATSFTRGVSPQRFQPVAFVVDQKTLQDEWVALEGFLSKIAECIERAEALVSNPTGQIHFWEQRQFKELCNAMGRHLPRVMALPDRKVRALAWLFPADEMIATPDSQVAATVVTLEDIVRRVVFTPTPHVITLFDTAEHYPSGPVQTVRDSYYREYLANGIPRERIYEIWSNHPQVNRGTVKLPRNTVITEYSTALAMQCRALESVSERLRRDYKGQFKARATHIPTSIPTGGTGVAFDGKLWIWWDKLEFNASQLEAHIRLAMDGDRLEATYEAIILNNGTRISQSLYEFDVPVGSREAKFKEDSKLTLGKLGYPGLPLEPLRLLLNPSAPAFTGNTDLLMRPLWSAIDVTLRSFNRVTGKAQVEISSYNDAQLVPYMVANSNVNLLNDVFLLETKSPSLFNWSTNSRDILLEIGDPVIATPDMNAAKAMNIRPPRTRKSSSYNITPPARVLWDAGRLEQQVVFPTETASSIATYVQTRDGLNQFQAFAVQHAAERALTVIWGPPGTGKTNTLAAILHGLAQDATANGRSLKILVTGPNYKAVEETMERTSHFIAADPSTLCSMYFGYSPYRPLGGVPAGLPAHLTYVPFAFSNQSTEYRACQNELSGQTGVVIVGCQVRQARRFPKTILGSYVRPIFDVVIIDESSQVPVSESLAAIGGLKDDARLIIAGDHLQMPPITILDPPQDAAYLVGSIQTYLLERTFSQQVSKCVLEVNYRSNQDIVDYAREIGYPTTLSAGYPDTVLNLISPIPLESSFPSGLPWCPDFETLLSPNNKVIALLHQDEVSSQGNEFESQVVAGIVWMLRNVVSAKLDGRVAVTHSVPTAAEFWEECVGIVTPHRAQRALVIRALDALFPGEKNLIEEAVDTVERFQGGERHTIIVTFGVADTDVIGGEEAFLMQLERTNVAVSRAMAKSIVVMPKTLAEHIPEDKKALATAFALKLYIEEFCNIRVDTTLTDAIESRWAQIRYHA